jgi:cytochrome o ubiquinol oxidase subunit 2
MHKRYRFAFFILFTLVLMLVLLCALFFFKKEIAVLNPQGVIALKERNLLFIGAALMSIIVIPVFILSFVFTWKYRHTNTKAKYEPDLDRNHGAEILWWFLPLVIVGILSVITWKSTHELDPFKSIDTDKKPLRIQVVALNWKWLFIYPEEGIASVNFFQFPEKTPIAFEITSDAPMNSFWIPQLSGQIYAMSGMKTELHLIADAPGDYRGSSANISGEGFSGMRFIAKSSSDEEFKSWVNKAKKADLNLTLDEYNKLAEPSIDNPVVYYSMPQEGLFDQIIMKYMMPMSSAGNTN